MRKKIGLCATAILIWFASTSFSVPKAESAEPELPAVTPEIINRLEIDDFDTGIILRDGSVNYVRLKHEAEYVAKVLYGTARTCSANQKETVVWCIINRVESKWYPDSISKVCGQSLQFRGYDPQNPVESDSFDVAYSVLYQYYVNGYRPCSADFLYLSDEHGITLRTSFEENSYTQYWRMES